MEAGFYSILPSYEDYTSQFIPLEEPPHEEKLPDEVDIFLLPDSFSSVPPTPSPRTPAALDGVGAPATVDLSKTEPRDPFLRFWKIANILDKENYPLLDDIAVECEVVIGSYERDIPKLKSKFTADEIDQLASLLEWFILLEKGIIPENREDFEDVKSFLRINHCIDMLTSADVPCLGENKVSIKDICIIIIECCDERNKVMLSKKLPLFQRILNMIGKEFSDLIATDQILVHIEKYFEFDESTFVEEFMADFDEMDTRSRFRWALFASVSSYHLEDRKEGLTAKAGEWPSEIHEDFLPLLQMIDENLRSMQAGKSRKKIKKMKISHEQGLPQIIKKGVRVPSPPRYPIDLCKLFFPEMPNWMPNGGNSCYVSSTIWPLGILAKEEMSQRIQFLQTPGNEDDGIFHVQPDLVRKARSDFFALYSAMTAPETRVITEDQMNAFRKSMQLAFPGRYMHPTRFAQEDPYEFLVCVMCDLLSLRSCDQKHSPKFIKAHTFARASDEPLEEPEKYKYEEAFESAYNPEPFFIDITLDEYQVPTLTLKDLVTKPRQTGDLARHAYNRVQAATGPKDFRPVMAKHTEQLLVESKERAPEYFVARLKRFSMDPLSGARSKRFDMIFPDASLDFKIRGQEEGPATVPYDFVAITVHSGNTIDSGHYYTYFWKQAKGGWKFFKYDDRAGTKIFQTINEVLEDAGSNGYILYYKKRGDDVLPPPKIMSRAGLNTIVTKKYLFKEKKTDPKSLKRPLEHAADASLPNISAATTQQEKPSFDHSILETREWVGGNLNRKFFIDLEDRGYHSLGDLLFHACQLSLQNKDLEESQILSEASEAVKRPIFLIDPLNDKEMMVIEGYPIPDDLNRFGEQFSESPTLYVFKQSNGIYVILQRQA